MNKGRLMKNKILKAAYIFFAASLLFAKGRNITKPKTVVALSKSVAEMWLLAGGTVSGTTDDGLELKGAENAASIGGLTTSSVEAIISLNPDLVILTQDIPLHKKIYSNLKTLGINTYVADVKNFSDYEKVMKDFTLMTGRSDLYKTSVLDVKEKIKEVATSVNAADTTKNKPTYLFLRVSSTKNKVLKNHFGNEIFSDLGLKPIVEDDSSLDEIGMEAIVASDPDYIFVVQQGKQKNAEQAFYKAYESNPAWKNLSAVKKGRVFILPKELFNYKPNARWAEAYEDVNNLLRQ